MAVQRHPPPAVNGKRIKPKYMAQTKARPPTFVLFASRADQMPEQYRRYLTNSLRESFDLPGVPIRMTLKSGKNPYAEGEAKGGAPSYDQTKSTARPETKAFGGKADAKRKAAKSGLKNKSGGPKAGSTKSVAMKSARRVRSATKGGRRPPSSRGS
jgi:GTP-binding protein